MPGKDGTGPVGAASGRRGQRGGAGEGRLGYCVCPKCGYKIKHTPGIPCTSMKCSKCGTSLIRDT